METVSNEGVKRVPAAGKVESSSAYDWGIALLSLWMIGGVYLDAWAHHEFTLESFFSPWHGVLYSGFLAVTALLAAPFLRGLLNGAHWRKSLPAGYGLSLLGAGLFMAGGFADMVWHSLLGIEENIEALLSPPHLLLALGGLLIASGPLRAAQNWKGGVSPGWPALLSLTLVQAIFAFFTGYAHPLIEAVEVRGGFGNGRALAVAGILLQTAILIGVVLYAVRRWRLPFGSLALLFTLSSALALGIHEDFSMLPYIALAGLMADFLNFLVKPSPERPGSFRLFAFAVPIAFYTLYFLSWMITGPFAWRPHLWMGAILLAGAAGLLLSYAFLPPEPASD